MEAVIASVMVSLLVVGPLGWRVIRDRQQERALALRADVQRVVDRRLGGESLVSVTVAPRTVWQDGRVVVSVPPGWETLVDPLWSALLDHVPAGYTLVIPGRGGASEPFYTERQLPRAA